MRLLRRQPFGMPLSGLLIFLATLLATSPNAFSAENAGDRIQAGVKRLQCSPTPPDALGPFYKPDAPFRDSIGNGYELSGTVMSAKDCSPIRGAQIEIWMAGPDGEYRNRYRAIIVSDNSGSYRFESHFPPAYFGRPPHHHLRVTVAGFKKLITQHYPEPESTGGEFDLVLIPD